MRSKDERDKHFRPGFKIRPPKSKPVPGWDARRMEKHQGPLGVREMRYRTEMKTTKELTAACRAGQFPMWRYDRTTGRVWWHRLEVEACLYWKRAMACRRRPKKFSRTISRDALVREKCDLNFIREKREQKQF